MCGQGRVGGKGGIDQIFWYSAVTLFENSYSILGGREKSYIKTHKRR